MEGSPCALDKLSNLVPNLFSCAEARSTCRARGIAVMLMSTTIVWVASVAHNVRIPILQDGRVEI